MDEITIGVGMLLVLPVLTYLLGAIRSQLVEVTDEVARVDDSLRRLTEVLEDIRQYLYDSENVQSD